MKLDDDNERELFGWFAHPLFIEDELNEGSFKKKIYLPPIQDEELPINSDNLEYLDCELEYTINYSS